MLGALILAAAVAQCPGGSCPAPQYVQPSYGWLTPQYARIETPSIPPAVLPSAGYRVVRRYYVGAPTVIPAPSYGYRQPTFVSPSWSAPTCVNGRCY